MGTQHAHTVAVKKNTSTVHRIYTTVQRKDTEYRSSVHKISGRHKHAQKQLNGIEYM